MAGRRRITGATIPKPGPVMEGVNRNWWLLWEDTRAVKGGTLGEERGV